MGCKLVAKSTVRVVNKGAGFVCTYYNENLQDKNPVVQGQEFQDMKHTHTRNKTQNQGGVCLSGNPVTQKVASLVDLLSRKLMAERGFYGSPPNLT